jgi:hypothetical protein
MLYQSIEEARMKSVVVVVIGFVVGSLYGNYDGDQMTVRNCAARNYARMAGGSTIKCEVVATHP